MKGFNMVSSSRRVSTRAQHAFFEGLIHLLRGLECGHRRAPALLVADDSRRA